MSVTTVSAAVTDNTYSVIGTPADLNTTYTQQPEEETTLFGFLGNMWYQLKQLFTPIAQESSVQSLHTKLDTLSVKVDSIEVEVSVSAAQVYITFLEDYATNGTSSSVYNDPELWDALCKSSVMANNPTYNHLGLEYFLVNDLDFCEYLNLISGVSIGHYTTYDEFVASVDYINNLQNQLFVKAVLASQKSLEVLKNNESAMRYIADSSEILSTICSKDEVMLAINRVDKFCNIIADGQALAGKEVSSTSTYSNMAFLKSAESYTGAFLYKGGTSSWYIASCKTGIYYTNFDDTVVTVTSKEAQGNFNGVTTYSNSTHTINKFAKVSTVANSSATSTVVNHSCSSTGNITYVPLP